MRKLWVVTQQPIHEDVFVQRYERLLTQALHITNQSRSAAEDLVHDAFIQFTLSQPNLAAIKDIDSYLFIVLRNMHLSQVRRTSQAKFTSLSICDYDSAEIGLRAIDAQSHLLVADELRRICRYACVRKESSKAASVLILRFFHGYYTSEIAEVIRASRRTVNEWLRIARREVKLYLANPDSLKLISQFDLDSETTHINSATTADDLILALRGAIVRSRCGSCLPAKQLQKLYHTAEGVAINSRILAHIVSCPTCLDQINKLRRLPPFSDRYPMDTLGPETHSHGGGEGMNITEHGGDSTSHHMKISRRRFGGVIDHQPQALSISANGFILGSQKVSSEITEQILTINIDEELSFVEVFSEQGIRLMFMGVAAPATGGAEQKSRLSLEEGRELECALSFGALWPTLRVTYHDPSLKSESVVASDVIEAPEVENDSPIDLLDPNGESRLRNSFSSVFAFTKAKLAQLFDGRIWFRPGTVTAVFALILLALLAFWYFRAQHPAAIFATDLLQKSTALEESAATQKDFVIHRAINLEEKSATGELIARRRIEIWQSADRGITARRMYDERGQLLAGDWRRADGVQTLYHHGAQPKLQLAPDQRGPTMLTFDTAWQASPSAKEFSALIGHSPHTRVEERPNSYLISYQPPGPPAQVLVKATLTLSRADFRAIDQTLLIQQGSELREYSFVETSFERHRPATVAPAVFEPDAALLYSSQANSRNFKPEISALIPNARPLTPAIATPQLEIEVLRLLNQVGADTGEQVSVRRNASGLLQVDAVVDTEERKKEILQALSPVIHNPAVRADVETIAERVARQTQTLPSRSSGITIERIETGANSIPLEPELRHYLSARGVPKSQIDEEVQRFCRQALAHSSQVLQRAGALRNLAARFSPEELRTLDQESRAKWLNLIRRHAQALQRNNVALLQELGPPLAAPVGDSIEQLDLSSDAELVQIINRLFSLCSANDATVRSALSLSTDPSKAAAIKGAQFWQSLRRVDSLASSVANHQ